MLRSLQACASPVLVPPAPRKRSTAETLLMLICDYALRSTSLSAVLRPEPLFGLA